MTKPKLKKSNVAKAVPLTEASVAKPHPLIIKMKEVMEFANEQQNLERSLRATETRGIFRGAMAGAITDAGILSAKCPRLDQARLLGVESQPSAQTRIMFSAGFGHEIYLETQFQLAGRFEAYLKEKGLLYKREVGCDGQVDGQTWHGTPDFEISFDGGVTYLGVEAKSLVSNFSAFKHVTNEMPQMKHVLQAAGYMTRLNRDVWMIAVGHYFYANVNGDNFPPDVKWYVVDRNTGNGRFQVSNEEGRTIEIDATPEQITNYLRHLETNNKGQTLSERPIEKEIAGNAYDRCNYCEMQSYCNLYDTEQLSFENWLKALPNAKKENKK